MKIAQRAPPAAKPERGPPQPPIGLDDDGTAALILAAPTTEAAWLALTDRPGEETARLAARLTVTRERADQAGFAVAKALGLVGERTRDNPPVPPSWVTKLGELAVVELDALWDFDDVCHEIALVEPRWVETRERPVLATETSWGRVSRLITRVHRQVAGMVDEDRSWDALRGLDPTRDADAEDVAGYKQRGRDLIRATVLEVYGVTPEPTPTPPEAIPDPPAESDRLPLAQARALAAEVVALLAPYCTRCEVAGSIRRGKVTVGDIEIVCIPVVDQGLEQVDMFTQTTVAHDLLHQRCDLLRQDGVFADRLDKNGRAAFGPRFKRLLYKGFALDVFSVLPPAQWGALYLIRTGPAEFGQQLVLKQSAGGWLPRGFFFRDGQVWKLPPPYDADLVALAKPVATPTEESVFVMLGYQFVPPEKRGDQRPALLATEVTTNA